MANHSSTLVWKIPRTEEPGGLQSMGSQRVGHDWTTSLSLFTFMHWRRQWQPTPVFLPGEPQGRGSPVGCRLWGHRVGHDWSDLAAAHLPEDTSLSRLYYGTVCPLTSCIWLSSSKAINLQSLPPFFLLEGEKVHLFSLSISELKPNSSFKIVSDIRW